MLFSELIANEGVLINLHKNDIDTWLDTMKTGFLKFAVCEHCHAHFDETLDMECSCGHNIFIFPHEFYDEYFRIPLKKERRKEYDRKNSIKRQARIKKAGGKYTKEEIKLLEKIQNKQCYFCSEKLESYDVEHLKPISRGGNNSFKNLVLACKKCNQSKHSKTDTEFWSVIKYKTTPEEYKILKQEAIKTDWLKEYFLSEQIKLSLKEQKVLKNIHENKCYFCGVRPPQLYIQSKIKLDIKEPLSIDKAVFSCFKCHREKHNLSSIKLFNKLQDKNGDNWLLQRKNKINEIEFLRREILLK